jgi:hypothetical protein
MNKSPSLETLGSRDRSPMMSKLSSAERIASKLSMHNKLDYSVQYQPPKQTLGYIDPQLYDNNMSLQYGDLSILGAKNINIFSAKANSLSNSPRPLPSKILSKMYEKHQKDYDYSIISKKSRRILNSKPLRLVGINEVYK